MTVNVSIINNVLTMYTSSYSFTKFILESISDMPKFLHFQPIMSQNVAKFEHSLEHRKVKIQTIREWLSAEIATTCSYINLHNSNLQSLHT